MPGKEAEVLLDSVGITVNKNLVPFDPRSPQDPSGIRLGTPALTTRGFTPEDMLKVAELIADTIEQRADAAALKEIAKRVRVLADSHPLYPELT